MGFGSSGHLARHLQLGQDCEELASRWLASQGYQFLQRRLRTPFGEVDLVLRSPQGEWVLVEVKSLALNADPDGRVSWQQQRRLRRIFDYFAQNSQGELVRFHLVLVPSGGADRELILIEDFLAH